jgi:hypothetical protein
MQSTLLFFAGMSLNAHDYWFPKMVTPEEQVRLQLE